MIYESTGSSISGNFEMGKYVKGSTDPESEEIVDEAKGQSDMSELQKLLYFN